MLILDDTIVAIATPPGKGAIGIVRLSGNQAIEIASRIFKAANNATLCDVAGHSLVYGSIVDQATVDYVLVGLMREPHSFTGENIVEFYCHGGQVILSKVLELLRREGCRLAQAGEFTRRAFLNGKIDLTQAEAIADLIDAPTEKARQAAVRQLEGRLKSALSNIHKKLVLLLAELQATIEFSEDVGDMFANPSQISARVVSIISEIKLLMANADGGRILKDGYRVVICGRPNVGKSSLLNLLGREERALVTPIAGTTRDTLEVDINLEGYLVRLIDTAGLRETDDLIESMGIARARSALNEADLILWVADATNPINSKELEEIKSANEICELIILQNKIDLVNDTNCSLEMDLVNPSINFSTITTQGMPELHQQLISSLARKMPTNEDSLFMLRSRHRNLLERSEQALQQIIDMLEGEFLPELICEELQEAQVAVGELTGVITSEDLLDKIFADFCIGK